MSRLKSLLDSKRKTQVFLSPWLQQHGISSSLLQSYQNSHRIQSLGYGAWAVGKEKPTLFNALSALQNQINAPLHLGGISALILIGKTHYLYFDPKEMIVFGPKGISCPKWFQKFDWHMEVNYQEYSFLPRNLGLKNHEYLDIPLVISTKERAYFESLYLANTESDLYECYENIEMLWGDDVDVPLIQSLLEQCTSIKVKRLFLCYADYAEHEWLKELKMDRIHLGKGYCKIIDRGIYEKKYKVSVPEELYLTEFEPNRCVF